MYMTVSVCVCVSVGALISNSVCMTIIYYNIYMYDIYHRKKCMEQKCFADHDLACKHAHTLTQYFL